MTVAEARPDPARAGDRGPDRPREGQPGRRRPGRGVGHRLPRRDRQDRRRRGGGGRGPGRLAPGRPARPAADRRGDDRQHQVRAGEDRPRPVHRRRRVPPEQAVGPDARAPGPVPDPRRAPGPDPRRLRPDPPRAPRLADPPVPGAARHRGHRRSSSPPTPSRPWPTCAYQVNRSTQNIGARRLHTILERVLEDLSFDAPDRPDKHVVIDAAHVRQRLEALAKDEDLSRFIL